MAVSRLDFQKLSWRRSANGAVTPNCNMLNLSPIFERAIDACEEFGGHLRVPPLPISVYMMQRDVVNHLRYAATHYLPISLSAPYLQDSSLGPPYTKWAKFTNDDFEILSFACITLMRYTSRLVYMTVYPGLEASKRYREIKDRCDGLTSPICDYNYTGKRIGIRVNEDNTLTISRFGDEIESEVVAIADRMVIGSIRDQCLAEADVLESLNNKYSKLCGKMMQAHPPNKRFEALHESFWV